MAYMSQENKAKLKAEIAKVIPADWKWTLAVRHHSTLVLTIRQAPVDLIGHIKVANGGSVLRPKYIAVNEYALQHTFEGKLLKTFEKIKAAMNIGNHDRSDSQSDHFDVGWYIDIKVGEFEKPFVYAPLRRKKKQWARCSICKQATYVCAQRGCLSKPELTYDELKAKVAALEVQLHPVMTATEKVAEFDRYNR